MKIKAIGEQKFAKITFEKYMYSTGVTISIFQKISEITDNGGGTLHPL
jgi:hypothetical protein